MTAAVQMKITKTNAVGKRIELLPVLIVDSIVSRPGMIEGDLILSDQKIGSEVCVAPAAQHPEARTGAKE
jgi:hypothetical protein